MNIETPFKLTMPDAEAELLRASYKGAGVILEYGTGGSTMVAAQSATQAVFGVESDADWLASMQTTFRDNPPPVPVHLHHGNIGKTKKWGVPVDTRECRQWPGYALSIWDKPEFLHPDVVLVDGRFRLACMLTTQLRITRPVLLLCDDYRMRPAYHVFEKLAGPPVLTGRMAAFTLTPQSFPVSQMGWIISAFSDPS